MKSFGVYTCADIVLKRWTPRVELLVDGPRTLHDLLDLYLHPLCCNNSSAPRASLSFVEVTLSNYQYQNGQYLLFGSTLVDQRLQTFKLGSIILTSESDPTGPCHRALVQLAKANTSVQTLPRPLPTSTRHCVFVIVTDSTAFM